jgi:hypothetical protein
MTMALVPMRPELDDDPGLGVGLCFPERKDRTRLKTGLLTEAAGARKEVTKLITPLIISEDELDESSQLYLGRSTMPLQSDSANPVWLNSTDRRPFQRGLASLWIHIGAGEW